MSVVNFDLSSCNTEFDFFISSISVFVSLNVFFNTVISCSKRSTSSCNLSALSTAASASTRARSAASCASFRSRSASPFARSLDLAPSFAFFARSSNRSCSSIASRNRISTFAFPSSATRNDSRIAAAARSCLASQFASSTRTSIIRPISSRTAGFNSPKYASHAFALPTLSNLSFPRGFFPSSASSASSRASAVTRTATSSPPPTDRHDAVDRAHDCNTIPPCVVALTSRFVRFGVVCSVVVSFTRFVVIVPSPSLLTPVRASFSFPRRSRASKTCVCGRGMRVRKPRSRCRSSMRRLLATIRRLKRMSL